MLIYATLMLCAVLLAMLVYRYDLYEKEPWYLLLAAAAAGYVALWFVSNLEDRLHLMFAIPPEDLARQALVAAVCEELAKLLLVVLLALLFRSHFNDPMDGLIYGAFVGLGMAVHESAFYLSLEQPGVGNLGSEAVRLMLHLLLGGLSGFAVGLLAAKRTIRGTRTSNGAVLDGEIQTALSTPPLHGHIHLATRLWWLCLVVSLLSSLTLHFLWDYWVGLPVLTSALAGTSVDPVGLRFTSISLMLSDMAFFGGAAVLASRWSRLTFDPTSTRRLWKRSSAQCPP
jgi:RsiW-degrading membrane proteinase PrsW (M82 family)